MLHYISVNFLTNNASKPNSKQFDRIKVQFVVVPCLNIVQQLADRWRRKRILVARLPCNEICHTSGKQSVRPCTINQRNWAKPSSPKIEPINAFATHPKITVGKGNSSHALLLDYRLSDLRRLFLSVVQPKDKRRILPSFCDQIMREKLAGDPNNVGIFLLESLAPTQQHRSGHTFSGLDKSSDVVVPGFCGLYTTGELLLSNV